MGLEVNSDLRIVAEVNLNTLYKAVLTLKTAEAMTYHYSSVMHDAIKGRL